MKRWFWLILAVAAIMRFAFIWQTPLWYDENFTLLLVRLPLDRMLAATAGDVHPPLFYLLLWPLGQIPGLPVWVLRVPSAIFSVLAVWMLWKIIREMAPSYPVRSLLILGIFALLPQQLYYAQDARMYALLTALFLGAWLAVLKRSWVWLFILGVAMVYTHNYGLFYLASIWLAGMFYSREDWKPLTLFLALAGLCWAPWGFILCQQMLQISGNYWILPVTAGAALGDLEHAFFVRTLSWPVNILNALVFFGWVAFALVSALRTKNPTWTPIVILALGPWTMAIIVSMIVQPVMLYRALVPSGGFLVILLSLPVGVILNPFRSRWRFAIIALLAPVILANVIAYYHYPEYNKVATSDVIQLDDQIRAGYRLGDVVYHTSDYTWINNAPYPFPIPEYRMPPCEEAMGSLSLATRTALDVPEVDLSRLDYARAWLILLETPYTPACEDDTLQPILARAEMVSCVRDDPLMSLCLYRVTR